MLLPESRGVALILLLAAFVLPATAQDVKLKKVAQETVAADRDTLSAETLDEEVEFQEMPDSAVVDSLLPWPLYMTHRIDRTMQTSPYMKGVQAGVVIYDLTADSLLYNYEGSRLLKPASNMKLFSSITALKELGAAREFKTRLYLSGEIRQDTIYLVPDSVRLDIPLEELNDSLGKPLYVFKKVLHGNMYGVGGYDPMFSTAELNRMADVIKDLQVDSIAGDFLEDEHFRYMATVAPLQVNKEGNFMGKLKTALQRRGISCPGEVGTGRCSEDTVLVAYGSHTLRQIMNRMMKQSDNQYAEDVYQHVNAVTAPVHAVKRLIKELGFNPDTYTFGDGSGLSHSTRVSAELEVALLRYARAHEPIYIPLYETLPIAGVDGTLGSRMKDGTAYRNVRAKTGTINGVITLAGYCRSANGHELAFAILLNEITSQITAKALEDELCTIMTHDETMIPKKKVITVKRRAARRRRPVARPRKKR